ALPPLIGLGLWQQATYGSMLTTGYQAARMSPGRSEDLGSFMSLKYLVDPPYETDQLSPLTKDEVLPNSIIYGLQLLGWQAVSLQPGIGFVGLIGLVWLSAKPGPPGTIGRFGLANLIGSLAVYLPYFFQSWRFLYPSMALAGVGAACWGAFLLTRL